VTIGVCASCQAAIEWVRSPYGKRMPLDLGLQLDGNLVVDAEGVAYVTNDRPARRSHFVTCPQAGDWRKGRKP